MACHDELSYIPEVVAALQLFAMQCFGLLTAPLGLWLVLL